MTDHLSVDPVVAGRHRFGLIAVAGLVAVFLVLMVFEQAGMPDAYGYMLTGCFLVGAFVFPGVAARTAAFDDWQVSRRLAQPVMLAMSLAAPLIMSTVFLALPGNLFAHAGGSAAQILGPICGFALSAVLVLPFLRKSGVATPMKFLAVRYRAKWPLVLAVVLFAAASFLMLWAQLQIAGAVSAVVFSTNASFAIVIAACLATVSVLPGGLNGVVRTNSLAYILMATAFLAPLIWLSIATAGLPIPQIAVGPGALSDIGALEQQLSGLGLRPLAGAMNASLPVTSSPMAIACMTLFLALGFATFPPLLSQASASRQIKSTRPAMAFAIVFAALVVSAMPAAADFAKLAIYNGIFGLTAGEIQQSANWVLQFGGHGAPLSPGEPMVTLCGKAVATLEAAIAACGGNPDYALGPADLVMRGELVTLALPEMAQLPSVFTMATGAAVVAAALATANASAFALSAILVWAQPNAGMNRLFAARLVVGAGIAAAAFLAVNHPAPSLDLVFWSLAVGAGGLAPALILAIWWDKMHATAAIGGLLASIWVLLGTAWLSLLGPDMKLRSGDELELMIPGLFDLPLPMHSGLIAAVISCAVAAALCLWLKRPVDHDLLERLRLPDAPQPD